MRKPLNKIYITQPFGVNYDIYKQFGLAGHNGIDYRTKYNPDGKMPVYAVMDGKVLEVKNQGNVGYGKYVRLQHSGNEETIYAHLDSFKVNSGQEVKEGDQLGITDNTGFSTAAHLHFGWRPENYNYNNGFKGYEDPEELFNKPNQNNMYDVKSVLKNEIEEITNKDYGKTFNEKEQEGAADDLKASRKECEFFENSFKDATIKLSAYQDELTKEHELLEVAKIKLDEETAKNKNLSATLSGYVTKVTELNKQIEIQKETIEDLEAVNNQVAKDTSILDALSFAIKAILNRK